VARARWALEPHGRGLRANATRARDERTRARPGGGRETETAREEEHTTRPLAIGMISCRQRQEERAITLAGFDRAGLRARVFESACDPPSAAANRANGERVLTWAAQDGVDLLFVEDDIDLAPDFVVALAAARDLDAPVTFWLESQRQHPTAWLNATPGAPPTAEFATTDSMIGWYGTQCVLLPFARVQVALAHRDFGNGRSPPIDIFLRRSGALDGLRIAFPNPVEHRSPPTLVNQKRPRRVSRTFNLPRVGSWEEAAWRARMT
jgi:hypothetical protein